MSTQSLPKPILPARALSPAKAAFYDLFDGAASPEEMQGATDFLCGQLDEAAQIEGDLPADMNHLVEWMENGVAEVGEKYRAYLEARQAGAPREYFAGKASALHFIKGVAPTKMVDGAWLYGLLPHWQDPRFASLIQTYLEELGEGLPSKNHVVLYRKLLAAQGIEQFDDLSDDHYIQGAIQLALAYNADQFLPEVIGFNLGYEQLPLHLLISAYELKEVGIDPYYFTLHITVDNADSGHAKKAVDAIFDAMPRVGSTEDFYRRVQNGYKLNFLGASTNSVIESFDLRNEVLAIFERKGVIGQYAHSDYRRVAGRTVNDWLSHAEESGDFLTAMEAEGWFKRHQDPQNSRFWKLIHGERAKMFGVFSAYEQQVIYDWIAGDALATLDPKKSAVEAPQVSAETKERLRPSPENGEDFTSKKQEPSDFSADVRALEAELSASKNQQDAMNRLIALMSPAKHHSGPGLMATRLYREVLG
ncbi:MAG TPA: iron-containing redox enzyme family protein [Abditibacterium sp.]|jgi:hypothetical protein